MEVYVCFAMKFMLVLVLESIDAADLRKDSNSQANKPKDTTANQRGLTAVCEVCMLTLNLSLCYAYLSHTTQRIQSVFSVLCLHL